jgi:hypothetical protein
MLKMRLLVSVSFTCVVFSLLQLLIQATTVPTLQNIVATVNLSARLDLKTIALHARNAE